MSTGIDSFTVTPRKAKVFVERVLQAGHVPFLKSSPGMGKSAIIKKIAKEYNLKLIDIRLSTCQPTDLTGLPHFRGTIAEFVPFDMFPIASTELPLWEGETERKFNAEGECINCYAGWLIFLDEFNSALKSVQAAAYKLVLDQMVGLHPLHERTMMVAAGNLATDRAIVNPLSTAMQSRVIHINMKLDADEFIEDVVIKFGWDERILAYLSYMPDRIHDFRADHNEDTFCCPRTWEFMNDLIQGIDYAMEKNEHGHDIYTMDSDAPLFAGAITSGVAVEFVAFTKVFFDLPKIADILNDPDNIPLPHDPPLRYAVMTSLVGHANDQNFEKLTTYVNRFTSEFRVLFFRSLMIRKPELRAHKAFRSAMLTLAKYLHD